MVTDIHDLAKICLKTHLLCRYRDFSIFHDGSHLEFLGRIFAIHEYLVVFITTQNLAVIDAVVPII